MSARPNPDPFATLHALWRDLQALRVSMLALEAEHAEALQAVAPHYRASARNLLHYLAMRRRDLRTLQPTLAAIGLSSLGRAEAHALSTVNAVLDIVDRLTNEGAASAEHAAAPCDLHSGQRLLDTHTTTLLGPEPKNRTVRAMVTMPSEAASDYTVVRSLLDAGMDCMRINCAHDTPAEWLKMVRHLEHARQASGRHCVVLMDLAGQKLRTGDIEPGPAVQKVRPARDAFGNVTAPGLVWLTPANAPVPPPSSSADCVLHTDAEWLSALAPHDEVTFRDARGRSRALKVVDRDLGGVWTELHRTAYVTNETELRRAAGGDDLAVTNVCGVARAEGVIQLTPGDLLILTSDPAPGRGATFDSAGQVLSPARVSCTLPEIFADVRAGERVSLDDGRITGVVESASTAEIRIRVHRTPARGARLKADKGINLPDSHLHLPALTAKDRTDLDFIVRHADLVGLSFVNHEADVLGLIDELRAREGGQPGIVLKIETQRALARLPALLLAAMQYEKVAVMIARGDLAVECGYERLAEAQEQILWMCEAAHCPAIWATQVLETLAKEGIPSRAEITDAAMGHRAECVMLNKGPHIAEALHVLDDILRRMDAHQSKKRAMLRSLGLATDFDGVTRSGHR